MKLIIKKEINAKYIAIAAGVRYWEDAVVGGIDDAERTIPCQSGEYWCPTIDIETGRIDLWTTGVTAEVGYKVCDQCSFSLLDEDFETLWEGRPSYVPSLLSPEKKGYGDYMYMSINQKGFIKNWDKSLLQDAIFDNLGY